jgi:hypothetical protein
MLVLQAMHAPKRSARTYPLAAHIYATSTTHIPFPSASLPPSISTRPPLRSERGRHVDVPLLPRRSHRRRSKRSWRQCPSSPGAQASGFWLPWSRLHHLVDGQLFCSLFVLAFFTVDFVLRNASPILVAACMRVLVACVSISLDSWREADVDGLVR